MIEDNSVNDAKEQEEHGPSAEPPQPPNPLTEAVADALRKPEVKTEFTKEISVRIVEESNLTKLFERLSLVIASVTLLTLVVTFIVFYLQLKEAQRQTEVFREQAKQAALDAHTAQDQTRSQIELSKDSFRRDQQPYLWLTGLPTSENYQNPLTKEFQVIVSAHYKNFGKSPAIALQRYSLVEVGPGAVSRVHFGKLNEAKSITPPVEDLNFAGVTPPMKALPEMSRDDEIVLFTRFHYLDLLGHRYETDVCMAHLETGAWRYCETHNEIKDCEKVECEP